MAAVLANLVAEVLLTFDLHQPIHALSRHARALRLVRWLLCTVALGWMGLNGGNAISGGDATQLIAFMLFSISAATDLETKTLPPDAFLYGATLAGIGLHYWANGWAGLRHAVIAQAVCFSIITLCVAFLNLCDSGDIKLAMQFGAACGSLFALGIAVIGLWLACMLVVIGALAVQLRRHPLRDAFRQAARIQPPMGPLLCAGLLLAFQTGRP